MLVVDTGTFDVEFHMNAVSFCVNVEEFASDGDGSRERVFGVVDTLRPCQSTSRKFTCEVLLSIHKKVSESRGNTNPSRPSPQGGTPTR